MLDLLTSADGAVCGVTLHVMGEGQLDGVGAIRSRAVDPGFGWARAAVRRDDESERLDRRRDGARVAGRGEGARSGVHPVPPDRVVAGEGRERPAAVGVRGCPRRGRFPGRPRRQAVHAGAARARRPGAARHRGEGDHAPDACLRQGSHVPGRAALRGREVAGAVPDDPGVLPLARYRPGARTDPGRAGLPLLLRRRLDRSAGADLRARAVRLWRGRLHRRTRCEPARLELAAGGPGLRPPDRRLAGVRNAGPARTGGRPARARPGGRGRRTGDAAGDDGRRRSDPKRSWTGRGRDRAGEADRAAGRRARDAWLGGDQPGDGRVRPDRGGHHARGEPRLALA